MKTTLLTRLFASVVLALGLTAVNAAPIPLEEVKVGSTVTSEGIGIGWGKYLPVPEGEWEVVVRDEMTYNSSKANENAPVHYIQLLNKNEKAILQLVQIRYPNPAGRITPEVVCNEKNTILFDRMGTLEGQNFQLCKQIFKPYSYKQNFTDTRSKTENTVNAQKLEKDFIAERFGSSDPQIITAFIQAGKKGSNRLSYRFGFNLDQSFKDANNVTIKKIDNWLSNNLNKVDSYYSGEKINFGNLNLD